MIIVDVETTGTDPKKHSILSIGALDFSNPQNQFYQECRIFKGAKIDKEALKINGFSEREIKDQKKKSLKEIIKLFLNWTKNIKEKTIAGQNPHFDIAFLKASAERYKIEWPFSHRILDLHSLCYFHHLKRGKSLPQKDNHSDLNTEKILKYVGLPKEPEPHNALVLAPKWKLKPSPD
jgi:DNA polymerase-3 subunit epsilon